MKHRGFIQCPHSFTSRLTTSVILKVLACLFFALPVYGQDAIYFGYDIKTKKLVTIDRTTGQATEIGSVGFDDIKGLAYDSRTNKIYGVDHTLSTGQLISIDPSTGAGTAIGEVGLRTPPNCLANDPTCLGNTVVDLAFGPQNVLYGMTNARNSTAFIITIDLNSGQGSRITNPDGSIHPASVLSQSTGLAFHSSSGNLYSSAQPSGPRRVYPIDPATGKKIGDGVFVQTFIVSLAEDPKSDDLEVLRVSNLIPQIETLKRLNPLTGEEPGSSQVSISGSPSVRSIATVAEVPPDDPETTIDITPKTPLNFGDVLFGNKQDKSFTVENTGEATLTGEASTNNPFSVTTGGLLNLEPDKSQIVTVRFSPTAEGDVSGDVIITSNATNSPHSLSLNGFGLEPSGDTDDDGLTNKEELEVYLTDPRKEDTDEDGFNDGIEVAVGTDPLEKSSFPPKAVILLHGMNSNHKTWNIFVKKVFRGSCPKIRNGVIYGDSVPNKNNLFCYRIKFGAHDRRSGRKGIIADGKNAWDFAKDNDMQTSGDFSSFEDLRDEVRAAVQTIIIKHKTASIVLVGHSRGGLAARRFLQDPGDPEINEKSHIVGLLTTGTPHKGSRLGRVYRYLELNPKESCQGQDCEDDWKVVDFLRGVNKCWGNPKDDERLDVLRPTISDLADNSVAINELNKDIVNLPNNVNYGQLIYEQAPLGILVPAYSVFVTEGWNACEQLSEVAERFILGRNRSTEDYQGDGTVPKKSQKYFNILGFPEANKNTRITKCSKEQAENDECTLILHIDETSQWRHIRALLRRMMGKWWTG